VNRLLDLRRRFGVNLAAAPYRMMLAATRTLNEYTDGRKLWTALDIHEFDPVVR
jgi:hypothetical protein